MEFFGKNSQVNSPFFMDNSTTAQGINFEGLSDQTAGLPSDDPTQINSNNSPNAKSSKKGNKKKKKLNREGKPKQNQPDEENLNNFSSPEDLNDSESNLPQGSDQEKDENNFCPANTSEIEGGEAEPENLENKLQDPNYDENIAFVESIFSDFPQNVDIGLVESGAYTAPQNQPKLNFESESKVVKMRYGEAMKKEKEEKWRYEIRLFWEWFRTS